MDTLFPGMDPYLEVPELWAGFQLGLVVAICEQIQPLLSPRYVTDMAEYVVPEFITFAPVTSELPVKYRSIEVRTQGTKELVTVIEILAPANKRPGADAADAYDRKRREILGGTAHLLEIDLLRGGRRPAPRPSVPFDSYALTLSRAERRPESEIWLFSLRDPMPIVPIPLRRPDLDIPLALNAAFARNYRGARYDLRLDYHQPPPPPALPAEDAAWVDELLRARGVRPE